MKIQVPQNIENLLSQYKDLLLHEYSGELLSMYLFGSLTYDDFTPTWSDIDVFIIISRSVKETDIEKLKVISNSIDKLMATSEWQSSQSIEGYLVEEESVTSDNTLSLPYIRFGEDFEFKTNEEIMPFDKYIIAEKGMCYFGKTYNFDKPNITLLLDYIKQKADLELMPDSYESFSSIRLTCVFHWLAQTIVFLRDHEFISKSEALKREILNNSMYSKAYQISLRLRELGTESTKPKYKELLDLYLKYKIHAYNEILEYIRIY